LQTLQPICGVESARHSAVSAKVRRDSQGSLPKSAISHYLNEKAAEL
jgi:hypothetical protein